MKLTTASGKVYSVHFHHERVDHHKYNTLTLCSIHQGECQRKGWPCDASQVAVGMTRGSRKEPNPTIVKGCKKALGRALLNLLPKGMVFLKPARAEVWAEFLKLYPPEKANANRH